MYILFWTKYYQRLSECYWAKRDGHPGCTTSSTCLSGEMLEPPSVKDYQKIFQHFYLQVRAKTLHCRDGQREDELCTFLFSFRSLHPVIKWAAIQLTPRSSLALYLSFPYPPYTSHPCSLEAAFSAVLPNNCPLLSWLWPPLSWLATRLPLIHQS